MEWYRYEFSNIEVLRIIQDLDLGLDIEGTTAGGGGVWLLVEDAFW